MSHQGACSFQPAGDRSEVLMLDGDFDSSNTAQFEQAMNTRCMPADRS
jgi:hypothetical protein